MQFHVEISTPTRATPRKSHVALYAVLNIAFLVLLGIGVALSGAENPRVVYLALLFALCSSALLGFDGLNGRYSMLAILAAVYFLYYGMQDLTHLLYGIGTPGSDSALTVPELMILVGGIVLIVGYRCVTSLRGRCVSTRPVKNWTTRSLVHVGLTLWLLGTLTVYYWYFYVVTDKTLTGTEGISRLSQYATTGLVLANMMQPLGFLLLVYAWRTTRNRLLYLLVGLMITIQVLMGFVIDIKGMALNGIFLVIVTIILTEAKIPKLWFAGTAVFIVVAFPVFQAYRVVVTGNNVARTEVLSNFMATLERVISASQQVNSGGDRPQTFFERLSLKGSVQMIVDGTNAGVPFQHGYTLEPIAAAFLPRIVWPNKPDIQTGRLVNKAFHVSDQEETYISPSHLGELYWNFGWPGVIVGMFVIGALLGWVGRLDPTTYPSVTRLLLFVTTVDQLVHGFEGAISVSYVVWLRSLLAIGLLHLVFARARVIIAKSADCPSVDGQTASAGPMTIPGTAPYPNLMS